MAHGYYDLACPECQACFCASVVNYADAIEVKLIEHPEIVVETEPPTYDFDVPFEEAPPSNPWQRFMEATDQIREVLRVQGSDDGSHLVNRMVFAQYVSAFEAYLADTLIRNVERDPNAIARLVADDPKLKERRYNLARIHAEPMLVEREVRAYLRNVIYHQLDQVDKLYRKALNVEFLKAAPDQGFLKKAMTHRHDCVHRNGFDKDGVKLDVFTPAYIEDMAVTLIQLVGAVEASIVFKGVTIVPSP